MILLNIALPTRCLDCTMIDKRHGIGKCKIKKGRLVPETRPAWCPLRERNDRSTLNNGLDA